MKSFKLPKIVLLALAFALGIFTFNYPIAGGSSLALLLSLSWFLFQGNSGRNSSLPNIYFKELLPIAFLAILGVGFAYQHYQVATNDLAKLSNQQVDLVCKVNGASKNTEKWARTTVQPLYLAGLPEVKLNGNCILYLPLESMKLEDGAVIKVQGKVREIDPSQNNYFRFLTEKGIHSLVYGNEVSLVSSQAPGLSKLRASLLSQVHAGLGENPEAGLAAGLILGDKSAISPEVKDVFRASGLSHVLAISGLHLGIFYGSLLWLFAHLFPGRRRTWLRHGMAIAILWAFALLTGGTASACRAALMMTCLSAGRVFYLKTQGMNLLALAAIILLVLNPGSLFKPGFQLSFAAVAGIISLASPLAKWIQKQFPFIPRFLANSLSVTLTAQLCTMPFVLFHFGTFPTYFLLSNVLVLPLAWLAVHLGFIYLVLGTIPGIGGGLAWCLKIILRLMIDCASWIAALPGAVLDHSNWYSTGFIALLGSTVCLATLYLVKSGMDKAIEKGLIDNYSFPSGKTIAKIINSRVRTLVSPQVLVK